MSRQARSPSETSDRPSRGVEAYRPAGPDKGEGFVMSSGLLGAEVSTPTVCQRRRARVGIFDASDAPSGLTRYVDTLLDGIDTEAFEVTLFCRRNGPYGSRSGVRRVYLPEPEGDSSPAGAA